MKITLAISFRWSKWIDWVELCSDARTNKESRLPTCPGVYVVRERVSKKILYIGKAKDIRGRVKQGLINGKRPHTAGSQIRFDYSQRLGLLDICWAECDRPAALEEELLRWYSSTYNKKPKYNKHD